MVYGIYRDELPFYENRDFVNIKRFSFIKANHKFLRIINYIACCWKILKEALYLKPHIIHAHSLNTLPVSCFIAWRLKVPVIYDAHEYETETVGLNWFTKKIKLIVEKMFIGYADAVINVGDSIAEEYVKLYGITKPYVLMNCPLYQKIDKHDHFREEFGIPGHHIIFLYQGILVPGRGLPQLLEAFAAMHDIPVNLVIMGYGVLESMVKEYSYRFKNIHHKSAVLPSEVLAWTSSADIGLATGDNVCWSYYYSLPNKLFEYLMAGLPVLGSNLYEIKKIVEYHELGWVFKENTAEEIEKTVRKIVFDDLSKYKANTQKTVEIYNWENQEKTLINIYKELLQV